MKQKKDKSVGKKEKSVENWEEKSEVQVEKPLGNFLNELNSVIQFAKEMAERII